MGTYGTDGLSPGEREPLIAKLLDAYENDPDSGIHGAAEWTLRKWGQQAKLTDADNRLAKLEFKARGPRRWYVNSQGQTFALIEGPVEFRMGSPASDPDRIAKNETPHRRLIPRSFAIAAKEVTVEQYQSFARGKSRPRALNRSVQPGSDRPDEYNELVRRRGLLQLAQPQGGAGRMLRAQLPTRSTPRA